MATTLGRVQYLKISADLSAVMILRETPPLPPGPATELFLISTSDFPAGPRERFTNELSRALAQGLRVRIGHEAHSSFINELVVFAPFETAAI